jgi:hypothetical protein
MAFVIGIWILTIAATTIIGATWLALTETASAALMPPRGAAWRPWPPALTRGRAPLAGPSPQASLIWAHEAGSKTKGVLWVNRLQRPLLKCSHSNLHLDGMSGSRGPTASATISPASPRGRKRNDGSTSKLACGCPNVAARLERLVFLRHHRSSKRVSIWTPSGRSMLSLGRERLASYKAGPTAFRTVDL